MARITGTDSETPGELRLLPSSLPPLERGEAPLKLRQSSVGRAPTAAVAFLATLALLAVPRALAQSCSTTSGSSVPTGYQEYYVLGRESHVYNMMERVATAEGAALGTNATHSVVSAVAAANGQIIYYDHWEDGLDAGLDTSFPTFPNPQQASTLALGDGNAGNGDACAFTAGACAGDTITQGMAITLDSPNIPLPRIPAQVFFDGGDRIVTSGGPLSLIHNQDPLSNFIGGSVEVLSRQAYANATSYSIPAGEDLYLGNNTVTEIFEYVDIDIVAFQNGTSVTITSPGPTGGTVSFTLNQGQHYTNRGCTANPVCPNGLIDDATAAPFIRINSGTKISTTGPLAGMIHTGGDGNYATDIFPILPDLLHGSDYLIPSLGDNPAVNGNRPMNLYLFNPDPLNAITVTATDSLGSRTFNVPANTTVDYFSGALPNRYVPVNSAVRLTSNQNFWGLTSHDHQSPNNDWGYAWLATKFLTNNYTIGYSPGVRNPPAQYAARAAACQGGFSGSALNPGACDSLNRAPVWVGATVDGTSVKIDLDGDGVFDYIDTNSDDYPDNGASDDGTCAADVDRGAPGPSPEDLTSCVYSINALQSLRIFDWTDYDNTGTRIVASRPVSVVYGQDTDQATGGDPIQDTGYTIYPTLQSFLDPALTIDKSVTPTAVSATAGGTVTFTLAVRSYGFASLTSVTVYDDLPAGLSCAGLAGNYVTNSSRITYPDLSQQSGDVATGAACSVGGGVGGRDRLSWTLSPNSLAANQTVTVEFQVTIPPGAAACFLNDATDTATLGGSTFQATDQAGVVRTDIALSKGVAHDGTPEPGDTPTYTVTVANNGVAAEALVNVSDAIPPGTTVVPASITFGAPFLTGIYNAGQNAVLWTAPALAAAQTATLTFQVTINSGVAAGTVISNVAGYESTQTGYFLSTPADVTVVGPVLTRTKTVTPSPLHPNEVATFEITVTNTGAGSATNVVAADPLAGSNTTYVAGTLELSLNSGPFVSLTDAADADGGTFAGMTVQFSLAGLGPGQDVRFRFQSRVNLGTGGQLVSNQAAVSSSETGSADTNLVQVPIVGNATVTGHLFIDLDGDGTQDPGESNLPNVSVLVTDCTGGTQIATTDAAGNYAAVVPVGPGCVPSGSPTTLNIDENDPDIPPGSIRTGGADTQTVTAIANGTVATVPVGYDPPPLTITKTSSAGGSVAPGQTVTYAVTITNNTGVAQTGINVTDPVPTGTSYVAGSSQVQFNPIRATEYPLTIAGLTGTLTLNQALAPDYFVIVQGSDTNGDTQAAEDSLALTGAPAGSPGVPAELAASGAPNLLAFTRNADDTNWIGVVTVVECVADCTTNGFRLLDVQRVLHSGNSASGSDTSATPWTDVGRVVLFGGANGAGCNTSDPDDTDHFSCHPRLSPSGANSIDWTRADDSLANNIDEMETATSTVMVVQWGSSWTAQRVAVTGDNGGDQIDAALEYNTAAIAAVTRSQPWLWGTGFTLDGNDGENAEAVALTLGNGVAQNATETQVAAGIYVGGNDVSFDVYVMSHPNLLVDHDFLPDTDNDGTATAAVTTNAAAANRMAVAYNGAQSTGDNYPRPIFTARYTTNTNIDLTRRRTGSDFAAWVQGVSFDGLIATSPGGAPASLVTPATLCGTLVCVIPPRATLTVTYQVTVDNPLAPGITQVTNTATVATTQEPTAVNRSVTDVVVRPAVVVEPNNAGFALAGGTITFTQTVTNNSLITDSYAVTLRNDAGVAWTLELIDPASGAVIATDSNGDGTWDSGTVNTGSLAPGASRTYQVRVSVPGGTPPGSENTVTLRAVSNRSSIVLAEGTNEVTVLAGPLGFVDVLPDNSGVVSAAGGSFVAYAHRVVNLTGAADTFDLTTASSQAGAGWTTSIHYDTNGDGVYTPGTDVAITNTAVLANGASQLVFVRVNVPGGGAAPGTTDLTILTAISRNTPTRYDSASDTTTVVAPTALDLSGGGTRMVVPTDTAIFPGTLYNLGTSSAFEFSVSQSSLFGGDGLAHPTELWIDSDADGNADLMIARDDDGDGVWDTILGGYDTDSDGLPEATVAAGATLAYEIRKPIDAAQQVPQEFVTLTARAGLSGAGEGDSITAQWLIAALTRASIRGVRVDAASGVVEFATGMQRRTHSFNLYETGDEAGSTYSLLNDAPIVTPLQDTLAPFLYRALTRPLQQPFLLIEEVETTGKHHWKGPFAIGDEKLLRALERIEDRLDRAGVPSGPVRVLRAPTPRRRGEGRVRVERRRHTQSREAVRIEVADAGVALLPLAELQAAGLPASASERTLRLTSQGRAVPFAIVSDPAQGASLRFMAEELETDYTGDNVYLLSWGRPPFPMRVPLTRSADPLVPGFTRIERTFTYLASAPDGTDPFLWDILYSDGTAWPYAWWDPSGEWGRFELPDLAPGASGPAAVRLRLVGYTDHRHGIEARINGFSAGSLSFDGVGGVTLTSSVPAEQLLATGNQLQLVYTATTRGAGAPAADGFVYLDYLDIAAPALPSSKAATIVSVTPYDPSFEPFKRIDYLIVTHPDFREAAEHIAALKEAEGLNAAVALTDNAYDRFSGGIVEARAIQALIREAASRSGRLKYVLLLGDDTFDPQNFSGFGAQVFVPSLLARDSGFGRIPSENLYADLDGDGSPELAIGRLPVQTAEEAGAMADKIANQAALLAAQPGRHIFAVDNPRADDAPFRAEAEEMAAALGAAPETTAWSDIGQGAAAARAALLGAWRAGARYTHYFGHGGPEIWADEHLLGVPDVQQLGSALKPTLVLMWACESQWYLNLWGPSLGEALFLVPNGGAVASFGPSGIAAPAHHRALYERFYQALGSGQTLGEIIRRAKAGALAAKPLSREAIDGYNLIGDPALKLPVQP